MNLVNLAAISMSRGRAIAILGVSALLVAALARPVGGHDGGTSHLWNAHIKPMGDAGTINTASNPVHWTKLKGVPPDIADGIDNRSGAGFGLNEALGFLIVDTTEIQRRVTGTCPAGQAIRTVLGNGSVQCAAGPRAFKFTDDDTGLICNGGCPEGNLSLTAGTWLITAKIQIVQLDSNEEQLFVECSLVAGGQSDMSTFVVDHAPFAEVTVPMQLIATLGGNGNAAVNCRDADNGDAHGANLSMIAVRLSD